VLDSAAIHFARVDFHNDDRVFGIKREDRFSHLYIIGKTGTGKSSGHAARNSGFVEPQGLLDVDLRDRLFAAAEQCLHCAYRLAHLGLDRGVRTFRDQIGD
jgi:hypothetical protein